MYPYVHCSALNKIAIQIFSLQNTTTSLSLVSHYSFKKIQNKQTNTEQSKRLKIK
jgi:hypothetical protein